jgi:hypothetical protein
MSAQPVDLAFLEETQQARLAFKRQLNMAFHNARIALIANHDEGTVAVVDLESAEVLRPLPIWV